MFGLACIVPQQPSTGPLNFANDARLDEHWRKHGMNVKEFDPVLTKEQYLKRARDFFESKASEMLYKNRANGDALRFRPSTGEFGVLSSQRVIRTYFRPDSGIRYWERQ
jgi:pyocin large subunit-like protein